MKLAIFGATGRTGIPLVNTALEQGHEVVAFVRSPEKLKDQQGEHERLSYAQGDIEDASKVKEAIAGVDAVLSVLGPTQNTPDYQVSKGTQNIVAAMKVSGVRRLIISAGAGVGGEGDEPKLFNRLINVALKLAAKHVLEDMTRTVTLVRNSDLDWTVVRVPMLTDAPANGSLRVGMVGKGTGPRLSREDLADFIRIRRTSARAQSSATDGRSYGRSNNHRHLRRPRLPLVLHRFQKVGKGARGEA